METECQGTWRDYYGPTDGPVPEGAWLMQCDGCGELVMFSRNNKITLRPGASKNPAER